MGYKLVKPVMREQRPGNLGPMVDGSRLKGWQTLRWSGVMALDHRDHVNLSAASSPITKPFPHFLKGLMIGPKAQRGASNLDIMLVLSGGAMTFGLGLTFGISAPVAGIIAGFAAISYLYGIPITLNTTMFLHAHLRRLVKNRVLNPILNNLILPKANAERAAMGKVPLKPYAKVPGEVHFRDLLNGLPVSLYAGLAGLAVLGYAFGAPALIATGAIALLHLTISEIINRSKYPDGEKNVQNRFPWIRPKYKTLETDQPKSLLGQAWQHVREYNQALYRSERSFTIEAGQDFWLLGKWILTDKARRKPALKIASALVIWGGLSWATVGALYWAANSVVALGLSVSGILSAVGIYLYVLGAMTVRWSTTIGFQGTILQALKRDAKYYRNPETDRAYAAGKIPVNSPSLPCANEAETVFVNRVLSEIGQPLEGNYRLPRSATIHYVATEPPELMERGTWASFLIDNGALNEKLIHVNMTRGGRDKVLGVLDAVDRIRTKIEDWRTQASSTPRTMPDTIKLLRHYRDEYEVLGQGYIQKATSKFINREQGEGGALDERIGLDFKLHAQKWEEKAQTLEIIDSLLQNGQLTTSQASKILNDYFSYLQRRFTYDVIVNSRIYCYADINYYSRLYSSVAANLPINNQLDPQLAQQITDTLAAMLKQADRNLTSTMYGRNAKDFSAWLAEFQKECISTGRNGTYFLAVVAMEAIAQPSWGGGAKAGGQDNWYSKVGSVKVIIETPFVTDAIIGKKDNAKKQVSTLMEFSLDDWLRLSNSLISDNPTLPPWIKPELVAQIRQAHQSLAQNLGLTLPAPATPATIRQIVAEINSNYILDRNNRQVRDRQRMIERLGRAALENNLTTGQFLREALFVALNPRLVEWVVWQDYDFILSFDKDYLPTSINETTGDYDDGLRNMVSHLFRLQRDEGGVNVSVIQGNQFYANYIIRGPQTIGGQTDPAGRSRLASPTPLELTNNAANIDQKTWYGEIVSPAFRELDVLLNRTFTTPTTMTIGQFLDAAHAKIKQYLDPGVTQQDIVGEINSHHLNFNWGNGLTAASAQEVVQHLKNHINKQTYGTGLLSGRDVLRSVFNCGTCRLENLVNIFSAFSKPYVIKRNGHIMAQIEFAYDPSQQRTIMKKYEPRYPNERGADRSKESREHQLCQTLKLSAAEHRSLIAPIIAANRPQAYSIKNDRLLMRFANGDKMIVQWYWAGAPEDRKDKDQALKIEDCRRLEIRYPAQGEKYYRDFEPMSNDRYYEINRSGRWKNALVRCGSANGQKELDNLEAISEINRSTVNHFNIPGVGDFLEVEVFIPDITVDYVTLTFSERLKHPSVHMPDKWITEDMKSTYQQNENGFEVRNFPNKSGEDLSRR